MKRKPLKPEEVREEWRNYYNYEKQETLQVGKARPRKELHIWATCPLCGIERWQQVGNIRAGGQSPRCHPCIKGRHSPMWTGGHRASKDGYVLLHRDLLPRHEQEFFEEMFPKVGYIQEHRLVMARHLGRLLHANELVHHINGIKDDNRLVNLRLLKKSRHHRGHGDLYYQKWQEALTEIERLKAQLQAIQGESECQV